MTKAKEPEPKTYEECKQYITDNAQTQNWQSMKPESSDIYHRRLVVSTSTGLTSWSVADSYPENDEDAKQQVYCKLAKALYNAKHQGIV